MTATDKRLSILLVLQENDCDEKDDVENFPELVVHRDPPTNAGCVGVHPGDDEKHHDCPEEEQDELRLQRVYEAPRVPCLAWGVKAVRLI